MPWRKDGRVFDPEEGPAWMASHAALPAPLALEGRTRVFVSPRDAEGRARVGYVDLDLASPARVLAASPAPVLDLGALGTFDDSGVTTSCVVRDGRRVLLYYTGWTLGRTVPFYLAVGLAVSEDDGETFARVSPAPILDRDPVDPYLTASPCVLRDGGRWRMWYVSGTGWRTVEGRPRHFYHVKYAESADGVRWAREGRVCIDYRDAGEHAISRPCVVRDGDGYRMWYASRGEAYRIGYAESSDGLHWTRRDAEAGIDVSPQGWDAEMVAYPWVFDREGERLMLYNGNDYGRTGFGLARFTPGPSGTAAPPPGGSTRPGS